ncbi:hypothetical protein [Candidatus Desulforudis audaxviator]|uniref:hypothetical protein n=1 Tax=Candidatus Desulforudis audaxviator TaxID=471827 RepID=UPI0002E9E760|nr:hypothetical protein [Candidatus Desulforudis audaxviator]AZK60215.1 hypothetical protein Daudx_1672 [Candidatus Desulforudis audaxviator]
MTADKPVLELIRTALGRLRTFAHMSEAEFTAHADHFAIAEIHKSFGALQSALGYFSVEMQPSD